MTSKREVTLPESDQELREFLDHATVGLRWVGPDGRILWANRTELELVGYSESEYVGQPIATFFVQPETAKRASDPTRPAFEPRTAPSSRS